MEKSPTKSSKSAAIFLLLAAVLAGLSLWTSRLNIFRISWSFVAVGMDLRWMFWLPTLLSVACLLSPVYTVLQALHERKKLPLFIDRAFQEPFRKSVQQKMNAIDHWLHSKGGVLAFVGVCIFVIVAFLSNTALIRDREANAYLSEFVSDLLRTPKPPSGIPTVLQIGLFTASSDETDYLRYCTKIVRDLESANARAVLIDVREASEVDGTPARKLVDVLASSKVVVLAVDNYSRFHNTSYTRALFTFLPFEVFTNRYLLRIQPAGEALRFPGTPLDVSLELIRKFRNYSTELKPIQHGGSLVFGDYSIPITEGGWMLSRVTEDWRYISSGIYAECGIRSDTLKYYYDGKYTDQLGQYRDKLANHIFIVNWFGHSSPKNLDDYLALRANATSLENILRNNAIRKIEFSPLWLVIICLAISGLIAYKFRPLVSVLTILLLGVFVLVVNALLFDRANLVVEITYPLLSILMAMLIFPAVSFGHRHGDN